MGNGMVTHKTAVGSPFSPKLFSFLKELKSNNDREWFADNKAKFVSQFKFDGASLKTAPRGIDPNHPAIEDLRRKSFAGITPLSDKAFLKEDILDKVMSAFDNSTVELVFCLSLVFG